MTTWTKLDKPTTSYKKLIKPGSKDFTWEDLADYTWEDLANMSWTMFSKIVYTRRSKPTTSWEKVDKS